ncbi:TPA: hypothetical protein RJ362_001182 [Campylobacter jejuni]|nr:hypothetical protein [Campylobacter jejuni]HDV7513962.1 hypothetical protein [Campylobacter jejuni]HDV7521491.1 hypothetical protein [Campylobacter jejuni]
MKDYGISFVPEKGENQIPPNNPITSEKLDEKKVNELIDKKLETISTIKGEKGDKGEDGLSAYEIWKKQVGNENKSEDEFLASLKGEKGDKGDKGDKGKDANSDLKELQIINGKKLKVEFKTIQASSAFPLKTLALSRLGIKLVGDDDYLKINSLEFLDNSNNNLLLANIENETLNKAANEHASTLPAEFSLESANTESLSSFAKVKITSNGAYQYGNRYTPYYAFREYDEKNISVFLANDGLENPFYTIECELSKPIKEFKFTPWGKGVGGSFFSENLNIKIYIDDVLVKEINSLNPNAKEIDTDLTISFNIQENKLILNAFKDEIDEKFRELENKFINNTNLTKASIETKESILNQTQEKIKLKKGAKNGS